MDNPDLLQARAIFNQIDTNGDGKLSPKEVHAALSDYGYDEDEIESILTKADIDGDGLIMFIEFYHGMKFLWEKGRGLSDLQKEKLTHMTTSAQSTPRTHWDHTPRSVSTVDASEAKQLAELYLVHGMTKKELEKHMMAMFKAADEDGNGSLNEDEFRACFKKSDLNFSEDEINLLLEQVDSNHDGRISYQEFIPACFELLTARLSKKMLKMANHESAVQMLEADFMALFEKEDEKKTGYLTSQQILKCLLAYDSGLSKVQITGLMTICKENVYGGVKYEDVAKPLAVQAVGLCDDMRDGRYFKAREMFLNSASLNIYGMDKGKPVEVLRQLFAAQDINNTGYICKDQFRKCVSSVSAIQGIRLQEDVVNALCAAAVYDKNGRLKYEDFLPTACDILVYLQQETAIWGIADSVKKKSDRMLRQDNRPRRWRHGMYEPRLGANGKAGPASPTKKLPAAATSKKVASSPAKSKPSKSPAKVSKTKKTSK